MSITVRYQPQFLVMNKQGEFRCLHDRIEIEDCSVYCYDCDNEDMTDSEVTELLINDSDKEWRYEYEENRYR